MVQVLVDMSFQQSIVTLLQSYLMKRQGTSGPYRCNFSTDIDSVNTINTIHIRTMLKVA